MAEHDPTQQENELAAYLDGELDPQSVRNVEERLARDANYRAELHKLERAWDMLDRLPRAAVDEAFTKSTIEMVALGASQEAEAIRRELPRKRRRQRIAGVLGMLAALAVGFVVGTQLWPDPNARLLAELPVVENLDLYYQVDDIEFLRMLDANGLFADGDPDHAHPPSATAVTTDVSARREKIENMDPVERQDLLRRYERFSELGPAEQQRLSDLQAKISADPKSARLLQVLTRYHGWLKTIKPSERAGLAGIPAEKRVERIEHLQRSQRIAQRLESLTSQDSAVITRWIQDLVKQHRKELIASMSQEDRRRYEQQDEETQRRWLIYRIGGRRGSERLSRVTPDDIERLAGGLSEGARKELAKEPDAEAQRRLVGLWIFGTLSRSPSWRGDRRVNALVGDELLEFLQTEVPPAEREQLLKKPREEMLRELRKLYFERGRDEERFGPRGPGGPSFERRRGKEGRSKGPRTDDASPAAPPR